jgi:hypothetical protein
MKARTLPTNARSASPAVNALNGGESPSTVAPPFIAHIAGAVSA